MTALSRRQQRAAIVARHLNIEDGSRGNGSLKPHRSKLGRSPEPAALRQHRRGVDRPPHRDNDEGCHAAEAQPLSTLANEDGIDRRHRAAGVPGRGENGNT